MAAEKAAKEGDQPGVDGKGHEADGSPSDEHGRHKLGQLCLPLPATNTCATVVCDAYVCSTSPSLHAARLHTLLAAPHHRFVKPGVM